MNKVAAIIKKLHSHQGMTLIDLESFEGKTITALVIDEADNFKIGQACWALFKETEVFLSRDEAFIAIENRLPAKITHVEQGELLTQLTLTHAEIHVTAIITRRLFNDLGFQLDQEVTWYIKANEVMLSKREPNEP